MNKMKKKLKDSNCDLKSKGKQLTISSPDLQKSLGLRYINLLIGLIGSGDVRSIAKSLYREMTQGLSWRTERTIVESRYLFYGFDNEIRL